jgi:hypothetical protein
MSSFGEALDLIGLFGTSRYNPDNLTDNCVFVTTAYLLGKNSNELAESIQRSMPNNGSGGVTIDQTFDMLIKTRTVIDIFNPRTARQGAPKQARSTVPISAVQVHQWLG